MRAAKAESDAAEPPPWAVKIWGRGLTSPSSLSVRRSSRWVHGALAAWWAGRCGGEKFLPGALLVLLGPRTPRCVEPRS